MIAIEINNCVEIARSQSVVAKLLPGSILQGMVEKAVAKKLQEKLVQEGVEAVVVVSKD